MSKIDRLIASTDLEPFYLAIDKFCEEHLDLQSEEEPSAKIFADPIEGYAALSPWEVSIVDTSLFQRLRGIKQLGLAFLVYPTLGYSRFEHVIGVLARLKQVVSHIQANQSEKLSPSSLPALPTERQFVIARIAALCHDLGHCIFSHVSEGVLAKLPGRHDYPSAQRISEEFLKRTGKGIPIAEILSVCIVTSPAFVRFLQHQGVPHASKAATAREIAYGAAHLIMGLPIAGDPHSLFLAQLMSSG